MYKRQVPGSVVKSRGQEKRIWFGITQYQERLEIRNDKSDNGNYDVVPVIFINSGKLLLVLYTKDFRRITRF